MSLDELLDKIKKAVEELVTLEIITAVGPVNLVEGKDPKTGAPIYFLEKELFKKETKLIVTRIDLLQGDISTVIPDEFTAPQYQWLRDFHATREKQGIETIQRVMDGLKGLVTLIQELKKG